MDELYEIKQSILKKNEIDELSVEQLKDAVFNEEGINKEKANILFELKDSFLGKKNHPSWKLFFIDSITLFLLEDEISPGEIDNEEAQWLRAKIQYNGKLDEFEKALLLNLKKKSINFPEILHFKNKGFLFFESILFSIRYIAFLAVAGSILASIALFITSTIQIFRGLVLFVNIIMTGNSAELEHLIATFVSSIDGYLFATVLLIFSMGIYELFINKIDIVSKQKDSRPNWLIISSIDDLKSSLAKVILMILIVSFFEHSLDMKYENISDLLFLGVGILLIAAALFLTHPHKEKKNLQKEKIITEKQ